MSKILTRAEGLEGPMTDAFTVKVQEHIERCERELAMGYMEGDTDPMSAADRKMVEIQLGLHWQEMDRRIKAPAAKPARSEPKDLFSI